jgi:hypothetical protein
VGGGADELCFADAGSGHGEGDAACSGAGEEAVEVIDAAEERRG